MSSEKLPARSLPSGRRQLLAFDWSLETITYVVVNRLHSKFISYSILLGAWRSRQSILVAKASRPRRELQGRARLAFCFSGETASEAAGVCWLGAGSALRAEAGSFPCPVVSRLLLGHGGTPSPLPLSRAAQPFADHLRASRDPSVGGSGANPPDWRCATWDQARANESWRARPRPDGPPTHDSPP